MEETPKAHEEHIGDPRDFSVALGLWKDIDLNNLQKRLDAQGIEIVENQKENTLGRKRLAEQTRDFKKISDQEKLTSFKSLLKAYQGEIDNLTKRSKISENAFLSLYKILAEAPDPYPLLDAAVEHTARASESRQLEQECASLKEQLSSLKNIEKEKTKVVERADKLESGMENVIKERTGQKEAEMNALFDERLRNYEEREKDLQRQVEIAQEQLRDLRFSNDSTQAKLLDRSEKEDQETASRNAEIEYLTANLQRATGRATEMELRNEKLRAEMESIRNGANDHERINELEGQVSDLQAEASKLIEALENHKTHSEKEKTSSNDKFTEIKTLYDNSVRELSHVKQKAELYADYDEIKRELDIMKYVEFGSMEWNDGEADDEEPNPVSLPDPNANKANQGHKESLEALLMHKNRKIQDELTIIRVTRDELQESVKKIEASFETAQSKISEQQSLNDKLENDLLRLNTELKSQPPSRGEDSGSDPLKDLNIKSRSSQDVSRPKVQTGSLSPSDASILPIITNQRDRFRQRNSELEEELRRQHDAVAEMRSEVKRLQADNVKLYEKVRYTKSYGGGREMNRSSPFQTSSLSQAKNDESLDKYRSMYEESMDPFEAFKGREHSRAIGLLNPFERILLNVSGTILGTRIMRNLFVFYALSLHLFIFFILWGSLMRGGHDSTSKIAPHIPQS